MAEEAERGVGAGGTRSAPRSRRRCRRPRRSACRGRSRRRRRRSPGPRAASCSQRRFAGVSLRRVHIAAWSATRLNISPSSTPEQTLSWLPRIATRGFSDADHLDRLVRVGAVADDVAEDDRLVPVLAAHVGEHRLERLVVARGCPRGSGISSPCRRLAAQPSSDERHDPFGDLLRASPSRPPPRPPCGRRALARPARPALCHGSPRAAGRRRAARGRAAVSRSQRSQTRHGVLLERRAGLGTRERAAAGGDHPLRAGRASSAASSRSSARKACSPSSRKMAAIVRPASCLDAPVHVLERVARAGAPRGGRPCSCRRP